MRACSHTLLVVAAAASAACRGDTSVPLTTFRLSVGADPETFDPGFMSGSVEGRVAYQIYEGLYSTPPGDGQPPAPGVATHHEVSADGLTYTFHLREDARWSNGDPITAGDFVFAWLRILRGDIAADYINFMRYLRNGRAFEAGEVAEDSVGVRADDDHTLVVTLEHPVPYFLEIVQFYTFFPVHAPSVARFGQQDAFRAENIVSNGPYRIARYQRRNALHLDRNPYYWDYDHLGIHDVEMLIIEDLAANVTAFIDGRLDWTDNIPDNQKSALRAMPEFRLADWLGIYYYRFNVTEPPLDDPRVRRALSLAIDREELCSCTLDEIYNPAHGFVPPIPGYEGPDVIRFDPAEARRLLAEAGYPNGRGFPADFVLLYNTSENHRTIAQAIQDMWRVELGIDIQLLNQEWKVYLDSTEQLDYNVARAGWIGDYNDPNTFLEMWRGDDENNNTGWANAEYDALIEAAMYERDPAVRLGVLHRAEDLLLAELPVMPLYYYSQPHLLAADIRGWEMNVKNVHLVRWVWREQPPRSRMP